MVQKSARRYIPVIEPDSGASAKIPIDAVARFESDYPIHDRRQRNRSNGISIIGPFVVQAALENHRDE